MSERLAAVDFPLITNPFFYAVAIPAVLLLGLLDMRNLATSLVLLPLVPMGV